MKNGRNVRLRVEELESRLVPSAGTPWPYPTGNWSGYSIDTAAGAVTDVKGSWNVPSVTVSGSGTKYAASWLGIDGDVSNTVEQIGTDSDQIGGKAAYYAWYEMYPSNFYYINWATQTGIPASSNVPAASLVGVGDTISAEVQFLSSSGNVSTFRLTITDTPAGVGAARTFSTTQTINNAARSSAEWIVEQTGPLTNFSPETFRNANAQATVGASVNQPIGYYASPTNTSAVVYKMDIVNKRGARLDSTSELNTAGDFTVNYGTSNPSPPTLLVTHGPMERLANFQVAVAVVPAGFGSSQAVLEISPVTPTSPFLATEASVQPGFRVLFSHTEGTRGRSDVVFAGMAAGEGIRGTGLSWFGLPPISEAAVARAVTPLHANATAGGVRFESNAEPFGAGWPQFVQPGMASPPTLAFSEDVHIDRFVSALAVAAFLPILQMLKAEEEPARTRRLLVK